MNHLKSVDTFPDVVSDKLVKEISECCIAGPFNFPPFNLPFRCSS